jgi:predicted metal-dependent peptidase
MQLGGTLPPEKRVRKAVLDLCEAHPFYGSVAMRVDCRATSDPQIPTAGVRPDGVLLYNPDFLEGLDDAHLRGLVAHEVLHLVLDFGERRRDRDLQAWNTAQDVVINHMLVVDGFDLPPGGVIPEDGRLDAGPFTVEGIEGKTSESIYDELIQEGSPADLSGPNRRAVGERDGDPAREGDGTQEALPAALADQNPGGFDIHLNEEDGLAGEAAGGEEAPDWERVAVEAAGQSRQVAAERGTSPGAAIERIRERTSETVDWRSVLREQVTGSLPSGYTWRRPADKSRAAETYLPATVNRRLEAVVALDTSGSMRPATLGVALGELRSLEREYDELALTLVQHDATVQRVAREWRPSRAVEFEAAGRGGTSHRPVFEWLRAERPGVDALVAVTDGHTEMPESVPPGLDVVWVLVGESVREPDVGVTVRVDPDR